MWIQNDGLLVIWLLDTTKIDVLSFTFGLEIAFQVWKAIEEHLLPAIMENEIFLNDNLMTLKKCDFHIDEYLHN